MFSTGDAGKDKDMTTNAIQVNQLTKKYGSFFALNNLSFWVPEGKVCGFLGPNGAGKTTTINLILSLSRPTAGSISVFDHTVPDDLNWILKQVGVSLERPPFYPFLSGQDNLYYLAVIRGKHIVERIPNVLQAVGLEEDAWRKPVKTYSQGMRQRLALAAALLPDPRLFILDEPMNGLDPYGMAETRELILHWCHDQGKTVFLSSHLLGEMEQICDYFLIIHKGQLLAQGNKEYVKGPGEKLCGIQTSMVEKAREFLCSQNVWVAPWSKSGDTIWYTVSSEADSLAVLQRLTEEGVSINGNASLNNSLEGVFMALTRGIGLPNKRA